MTTLETLADTQLVTVTGGAEPAEAKNYQKDNIGVSAGGVDVGLTKEGWRSDYGLCLETAAKQNWTAAETKNLCGSPK
jgi:hypothetical protein